MSEPTASRPYIPDPAYGIPQDTKGLLPWSHVTERLTVAKVYWLATVSPEGHPHATPVDGLWLDNTLYFSGSPQTRRHRNLALNPAVCVHLESGHDVVILHGIASPQPPLEHSLALQLVAAHAEKYGYGFTVEQFETGGSGAYCFHPRVAFAWSQFAEDMTRWTFPEAD